MTGRRSVEDLEVTTRQTLLELRTSVAGMMVAAGIHEAAAEELFAAIAERRAEWLRDIGATDA